MEKANVIQKAFYRSAAYLKRHSPTILTFVGATGVVATIIMSARATPKAMKLLEEAEVQKGEELDKLETIRTAASVYIPVAAIGISSLICLFGANVLNQRNQASLTAAYVMLNESYSRYRGAANTVFGDDADSKIKAEVAISTSENRCWQKSKPKRKRRRRSPTWNSMNPMSKMRIPRIFPNKKKECSDEGKCL